MLHRLASPAVRHHDFPNLCGILPAYSSTALAQIMAATFLMGFSEGRFFSPPQCILILCQSKILSAAPVYSAHFTEMCRISSSIVFYFLSLHSACSAIGVRVWNSTRMNKDVTPGDGSWRQSRHGGAVAPSTCILSDLCLHILCVKCFITGHSLADPPTWRKRFIKHS